MGRIAKDKEEHDRGSIDKQSVCIGVMRRTGLVDVVEEEDRARGGDVGLEAVDVDDAQVARPEDRARDGAGEVQQAVQLILHLDRHTDTQDKGIGSVSIRALLS